MMDEITPQSIDARLRVIASTDPMTDGQRHMFRLYQDMQRAAREQAKADRRQRRILLAFVLYPAAILMLCVAVQVAFGAAVDARWQADHAQVQQLEAMK